jgi:hypothetical protein
LKFHHSGFIVKDIDSWEAKMVYEAKIADVIDPVQNARLCLYTHFAGDSFIELIQPLDEQAFTWKSLQKAGNHFNHFCYSVDTLEEVSNFAVENKLIPVLGPVKALLFEGKLVVFYYTRNKQIIEFLITRNENQDNS